METLSNVTRVIFDKTGTLTRGEMHLTQIQPFGELTAERARAIAAALEAHSEHPIARAFRPFREATLQAKDIHSHTGQGLEGSLNGARWRLGKPRFAINGAMDSAINGAVDDVIAAPAKGQWLLLSENGAPRAWFGLHDGVRDDAAATIKALQALGLSVELLSGDTQDAVESLANQLDIATWHAGTSPEGKLARMKELQAAGETVVMIGDGINDVPVLAGADVAIAMNGATDLARA